MNIGVIYSVGGLFLVATVIGIVLEQAGRGHNAKLVELVSVLVGLSVIVTLLGTLIGEVKSVFGM